MALSLAEQLKATRAKLKRLQNVSFVSGLISMVLAILCLVCFVLTVTFAWVRLTGTATSPIGLSTLGIIIILIISGVFGGVSDKADEDAQDTCLKLHDLEIAQDELIKYETRKLYRDCPNCIEGMCYCESVMNGFQEVGVHHCTEVYCANKAGRVLIEERLTPKEILAKNIHIKEGVQKRTWWEW